METDLITVCMPVYNGERYIKDAIDGVLNQTHKNIELLIIDDGSTDRTALIIQSYNDHRIRVCYNSENKGLIYTRNLGIKLARGSFIAFNDSDDISMPERLQLQIETLKNNSHLGLCGTSAYLINESNQLIGNIDVVVKENDYLKCLLLFSNLFVNSSLLFKADILKDKSYCLPLAEDYDLMVRLVTSGVNVANLRDYLVKYRTHASNVSKLEAGRLKQNELIILKRQLNLLDIVPTFSELELHYCFLSNNFENFRFQEIESWLLKLERLNDRKRIYREDFFLRVLLAQLRKYVLYRKSNILYLRFFSSKIFFKYLLSKIRNA